VPPVAVYVEFVKDEPRHHLLLFLRELLDSSGKAVDTEEASLEEMTLKVTYYVDFGKGANGKLETAILDGEGEEVFKDLERLEPGGETQEYEYGFHLQESAGEKFKARVSISVEDGGREVTDARRLGFYVEEGMSEDREFEQSKEAALARIDEAATMIADLAGVGVEVTDLAERVALAAGELETATTVEEATQVYEAADSVIQECDARKAAHEEAVRAAEREQNIAAARQSMFDYAYAGKGNCEDIWWVDFQINEEGNRATGTLQGMVTAHTDPDRAGQRTNFYLEAEKEGGAWVVTGYSYEHIP